MKTRALACSAPAAIALLLTIAVAARAQQPREPEPLQVAEHERLLVVAPHPDDESLGAGGLMQRVLARGGTVDVLLLTAGDGYVDAVRGATGNQQPRPEDFVAYGAQRIAETKAALATLDAKRVRLTVLGFPDGALAPLLARHWSSAAPERSATTGAADPPYDALVAEPNVPYTGEALRRELAAAVRRSRPTMVALPDPLDVHPDHRAAGIFAIEAVEDWQQVARAAGGTERAPAPRLLAYLVHWPGWPPGWDAARSEPEDARAALASPHDLPRRHARATTLELSDAEVAGKRAALACHATQQRQMAVYLAAFVRRTEPFTVMSTADLAAVRAHTEVRSGPAMH